MTQSPREISSQEGRQPRAAALAAAWVPVVLWVAVILLASGEGFSGGRTVVWLRFFLGIAGIDASLERIQLANLIIRKCAHLIEYGVLGVLMVRAMHITAPDGPESYRLRIVLALVATCAGLDEIRQASLAGRTGALTDILIDVAGAVLAIIAFRSLRGSWISDAGFVASRPPGSP